MSDYRLRPVSHSSPDTSISPSASPPSASTPQTHRMQPIMLSSEPHALPPLIFSPSQGAAPPPPWSPSAGVREIDAAPPPARRNGLPAPPTGHELMALFPAPSPSSPPTYAARSAPGAPPIPMPTPTSGWFANQERAFFAREGKEIVRLKKTENEAGPSASQNMLVDARNASAMGPGSGKGESACYAEPAKRLAQNISVPVAGPIAGPSSSMSPPSTLSAASSPSFRPPPPPPPRERDRDVHMRDAPMPTSSIPPPMAALRQSPRSHHAMVNTPHAPPAQYAPPQTLRGSPPAQQGHARTPSYGQAAPMPPPPLQRASPLSHSHIQQQLGQPPQQSPQHSSYSQHPQHAPYAHQPLSPAPAQGHGSPPRAGAGYAYAPPPPSQHAYAEPEHFPQPPHPDARYTAHGAPYPHSHVEGAYAGEYLEPGQGQALGYATPGAVAASERRRAGKHTRRVVVR